MSRLNFSIVDECLLNNRLIDFCCSPRVDVSWTSVAFVLLAATLVEEHPLSLGDKSADLTSARILSLGH